MTHDDERPGQDGRPLIRPSVDREVENELAFHIAMRARELAARGVPSTEAERRALAEFGDLSGVSKECRDIGRRRERQLNRTRFFSELARDAAFALRRLRRRPTFAALTTATIALGIGAATSIFSVVDGVMLRALPFSDPARLVSVWIDQPTAGNGPLSRTVLGASEYFALRDHTTAFENVAIWSEGSSLLAGPTSQEYVRTLWASASLLPVLGERVALGRGFLPEENVLDGSKVALVSWEAWTSRFGGDSAIIGRRIQLDENPYTIVGVLPRGLRINRTAAAAPFWVPALQSKYEKPELRNRSFRAVARLKADRSIAFAATEAERAMRAATGDSTLFARVANWQHDQTRDAREPLLVLLAASGLLLLIGCVNVAMLMLSESATRERELAARIALGAGRTRIIRQLLAESLTIAFVGAAVGAALAWALTRALVLLAPARIPGIDTAGVDLRALAFASICAAAAGVLFGLAPSLSIARSSESALLRVGIGQSARHGRRTQRWLVATEIALSFVLLVGAALLARSLDRVSAVNPGFRTERLAIVRLAAPRSFFDDDARPLAYYEEAVRRLRAVPGVETATAGAYVPFAGGSSSSPVWVEGREYGDRRAPSMDQRAVFPEYFGLLGIPLRAGRVFDATDTKGAELVAVISESAVRRDFAGETVLGRRVRYQGQLRRIVGVVGDVHKSQLTQDPAPAIYVPLRQYAYGAVSFQLRTSTDLTTLAPSLRDALTSVDASVSVAAIDRMPELVARSYAEERYRTVIVGAFAALAALLASVGLYGLTLRAVARRTREVGIRVALGATPGRAMRMLMTDTVTGALLGLCAGVPLALLAANRLTPFLFRVAPNDPLVFGGVVGLVAIVTLVASGVPARRAGRSNPAVVLNEE